MRRIFRTRAATAVLAGTVSILALTMFPGLATADLATTQGGSPSAVFMQTSAGPCEVGPQEVTVTATSHILAYFTFEFVGLDAHETGQVWFDFDETGIPLDWHFPGEKAANNRTAATVMWSFNDVDAGTHTVTPRAGPVIAGGKPGVPSASLEHCAFTVFVIPAA